MQPGESKYQQFLQKNGVRNWSGGDPAHNVTYDTHLLTYVKLLRLHLLQGSDEQKQNMSSGIAQIHRALPDLRAIALEEIGAQQDARQAIDATFLQRENWLPPILRIFVHMAMDPGFDIAVQEKGEGGIWMPCAMLDAVRRVITGQDAVLDIEPFRDTRELRFHASHYMVEGLGHTEDQSVRNLQRAVEQKIAEAEVAGTANPAVPMEMPTGSRGDMMSKPDCPFSMSLMYEASKLGGAIRRAYLDKHLDQLVIEAYYELQEVQRTGRYRHQNVNMETVEYGVEINVANPPGVDLLVNHFQNAAIVHNVLGPYARGEMQLVAALEAMKAPVQNAIQRTREARKASQESQRQTWQQRVAPSGVDLDFLRDVTSKARDIVFPGLLNAGANQPLREPTEWDWFYGNTQMASVVMVRRATVAVIPSDTNLSKALRKTILARPDMAGKQVILREGEEPRKVSFLEEAWVTDAVQSEMSKIINRYYRFASAPFDLASDVHDALQRNHPILFDYNGMPENFIGTMEGMARHKKLYIELMEVYAKHLRQNPPAAAAEGQPQPTTAADIEKHIGYCKAQLAALELMSSRDDKAVEAFAKRAVWVVPGLVAFAGGALSTKFAGTEMAEQALDAMNDMFKGQFDKLVQGLAAGNPMLLAMVIGLGVGAIGLVVGLWKGAAIAASVESKVHNYDAGLEYITQEVFPKLTPAQQRVPEQAR